MDSYCKPPDGKIYNSDADVNYEDKLCCICRTKETSRFMIGCCSCNECYHGDCISITEEYAKNFKQFFCSMCRERDPTLEIKFKEPVEKKKSSGKSESGSKKNSVFDDYQNRKSACRCGEKYCKKQCMNFGLILGQKPKYVSGSQSEVTEDTERLSYQKITPDEIPNPLKVSNDEREDVDRDADYDPSNKRGHLKSRHRIKASRSARRHRSHRIEHRKKHSEKEKCSSKKDGDLPRQCYNTTCTLPSRPNSKYCSDECGMKLAMHRIYEILPHRIDQWRATPSVAEENNRKSLEKIRKEQQEAKDQLSELSKRQETLEKLIEKAKRTPVAADQENLNGESEEAEISIYCVTCGHEIGAKNALKHMEKCFRKYESQTAFGSFYQNNTEGTNFICDYYDSHQKTYCKRLKILCPQHTKEPNVADDEVCGCPLTKDIFQPSGEFCCALRKKCAKHHQWEKFRRAEIDLDKMRVLCKLGGLIEQERNIKQQMANRGGVLGLMLHQTICHEKKI